MAQREETDQQLKFYIRFHTQLLNIWRKNFLVSLGVHEDSSSTDCSSSDDDSSVEITSTVDECENELGHLSTYFRLESEDEGTDDIHQVFERSDPSSSLLPSS